MSQGRWVTARSPMNRSLMCCAARLGQSEVVRLLLQTGVDPNKECASDRSTPIVAAAYNGKAPTVRVLLDAWACPSRRDRHGHSALFYARNHGNSALHAATFQMMRAHVPCAAARDRVGALQRLAYAACFAAGEHFALPGGVAAAVALLALPWIRCTDCVEEFHALPTEARYSLPRFPCVQTVARAVVQVFAWRAHQLGSEESDESHESYESDESDESERGVKRAREDLYAEFLQREDLYAEFLQRAADERAHAEILELDESNVWNGGGGT